MWRLGNTFGIKPGAGAWSLTSALATTGLGQAATCSRTAPCQILRTLLRPAACCCAKINAYRQHYADNQNISFLPAIMSTGPQGDRRALHCLWNAIATQSIGLVPFQARSVLPVAEEQSRTRGNQSGGVEDQPQCRGLCHSSSLNAHSSSIDMYNNDVGKESAQNS